jgi:sugar/nucleoside kinase (ribokinase family)
VCQLEVPQEATLAALHCAKEHSCTTVFNPAPAAATLLPSILEVQSLSRTALHALLVCRLVTACEHCMQAVVCSSCSL